MGDASKELCLGCVEEKLYCEIGVWARGAHAHATRTFGQSGLVDEGDVAATLLFFSSAISCVSRSGSPSRQPLEASRPSLAPLQLFQFLLDTHLRESK
jgi:hypothetical protein